AVAVGGRPRHRPAHRRRGPPPRRAGALAPVSGDTALTLDLVLGGGLVVVLLVYLLAALLRPEQF
ncbi:K(+)-transporting ATPase subunit F, partial [Mycobacterium tuberculosis]|nr:K(+)-transporting ATPase subunit F [Mycobacterium tuberculosis]